MTAAAGVNELLAERARQLAREYPPRTHERRAAAALYAALITTRTPASARRALAGFASPVARSVATALLDTWADDRPLITTGRIHHDDAS